MTKISIQSGGWFDIDAATKFDELTRWNGKNNISVATGDQWEHETLFLTKHGAWVLNHWSDWQGSTETYYGIDPEDAAQWLVDNGHSESESLPQNIREIIATLEK